MRSNLPSPAAVAFVLISVLFLIQAGLRWISADFLRHVFVAAALLCIPMAIVNQQQVFAKCKGFFSSRVSWADTLCLLYFLFPVLTHILFFPESWPETSRNWMLWTFSSAGLLSILLAPLAEEIFFRSWLLEWQCERQRQAGESGRFTRLKLCYINSLLFWLLHVRFDAESLRSLFLQGQISASPGPFFLGLVAATMTLFSGNIRAALIFHALANALGPLWLPLLGSETLQRLFYF